MGERREGRSNPVNRPEVSSSILDPPFSDPRSSTHHPLFPIYYLPSTISTLAPYATRATPRPSRITLHASRNRYRTAR